MTSQGHLCGTMTHRPANTFTTRTRDVCEWPTTSTTMFVNQHDSRPRDVRELLLTLVSLFPSSKKKIHAGQCAHVHVLDVTAQQFDTVPMQRNVAQEQKQCGRVEIDIA